MTTLVKENLLGVYMVFSGLIFGFSYFFMSQPMDTKSFIILGVVFTNLVVSLILFLRSFFQAMKTAQVRPMIQGGSSIVRAKFVESNTGAKKGDKKNET